jgi:hypothetical protein
MKNEAELWFSNLQAGICENCDWGFLVPVSKFPVKCPHCFRKPLSLIGENAAELPILRPPELYLPFELTDAKLSQVVNAFVEGIPFTPHDLSTGNLLNRLERSYLPVWLVDCRIRATWQAEVGFDYEVVSHQDHFIGGKWISKQVNEVRIRWEARLGRLDRQYKNMQAAALEDHHSIIKVLGQYAWQNTQSYSSEIITTENIKLPNRSPEDAWSDAEAALRTEAAEECYLERPLPSIYGALTGSLNSWNGIGPCSCCRFFHPTISMMQAARSPCYFTVKPGASPVLAEHR